MKKVVFLAVIAAVTMSMSAQAETSHKQRVASTGKQCWIATDAIGHGYWMSCGSLTQTQRDQISHGIIGDFEGGGGGGGGGGGR